jgi:hypothetical protein
VIYVAMIVMLAPLPLLFSLQGRSLSQASYSAMARRIAAALAVKAGERVILRFDPETMAALEPEVRKALESAGAVVETINYGPAHDLAERLERADVYVMLPAGPRAATPQDQTDLLARWLDSGKGRQVHFHWSDGTRDADGLNAKHSDSYDRVYMDALDIDYAALDAQMNLAIKKLKSGEVRVTTPSGTDIRFRVGERPFTKQNGDASKARMASAKVRIDREIELPAGALRVAPIEESVNGIMVIPSARIGSAEVKGARLEFSRGLVTRASADVNEEGLKRYLSAGPGLSRFREFALGLNPKLLTPGGERAIAYYGYGAGVVRLGLGDNSELGGQARGFPVRWLFFPDATVRVGRETLVEGGRIVSF